MSDSEHLGDEVNVAKLYKDLGKFQKENQDLEISLKKNEAELNTVKEDLEKE